MLPKCHTQSCPNKGVVHLEVESWRSCPPMKWRHNYCVKCAEEQEAQAEKDHGGFARRLNVTPIVGVPCTENVGSDSTPATVVEVSASGKQVKVASNNYKPAPGSDYFTNQCYIIEEQPSDTTTRTYSLRQNGRWVIRGGTRRCGMTLSLGFRRAYQDPHF